MLKLEGKGCKPDIINTFQDLRQKLDIINEQMLQTKTRNYTKKEIMKLKTQFSNKIYASLNRRFYI